MNTGQAVYEPRKKVRPGTKLLLGAASLLILAALGVLGISSYVGWNLTHPARQPLDSTPQSLAMSYEDVSFPSRIDGLALKGWLIRAPGSRDTIVFAHGYRKNRLNSDVPILPIARELNARGYNILMFDFRNSGESEGSLTSVGQYEVRDLLGAVDFIKSQPDLNRQIVLYGFSMGASTAIMAGARDLDVAAVIADSPFADLRSYLYENLSVWSELPSIPFNQAFFIVVPPLTGLQPNAVSPVEEVKNFAGRPLLLIHGLADADVPVENSRALQQAYPEARLLTVPGGLHVKNYEADPGLYIQSVTAFLSEIK